MRKPKLRELKEAIKAFVKGPYTTKFPAEPSPAAEHYRGKGEFDEDKCIACGSCAYICDEDAVIMADVGDKRVMITPSGRMEFKLKRCRKCGDYWIPEKQLEYMSEKANIPLDLLEICPDCRD